MSGCIVTACAQGCAEDCPIADLTDRIGALEKAVQHPGLWAWVRYLVDNAANLLLLAVGVTALVLLVIWLAKGGLKALSGLTLKSANLSTTGAAITFESAAQQVNAMLDAVQDYVVQDAALEPQMRALVKTLQPGLDAPGLDRAVDSLMSALPARGLASFAGQPAASPWRQSSFSDQPPRPKTGPLSILWVQEIAGSRAFERKVVQTMGNRIETRIGAEAARARLLSGISYDLVVIEDATPGPQDQPAGLELATDLIHGINTLPGIGNPRRVQAGGGMRLALLVAPDDLAQRAAQISGAASDAPNSGWKSLAAHVLVTDEFPALRRGIRWLQTSKAPTDPEQK